MVRIVGNHTQTDARHAGVGEGGQTVRTELGERGLYRGKDRM